MASIQVPIRIEPLDHDHDHWCNHCRLSTGVRATFIKFLGAHMYVETRLWCIECGSHDVTVSPDARRCS